MSKTSSPQNRTLTALKGVRVGHYTDADKLTGASVVVFDKSLPVAYKSYGGGAGTFNTDMLDNGSSFYHRQGLFIAGGSLGGLAAASTIMECMVKDKIGTHIANIYNPSISGAIVFDLGTTIGQFEATNGARAYKQLSDAPVESGNVGAGTGTSVGKLQFFDEQIAAMKSGVGSGYVELDNGIVVVAMSVVNAVGNVIKDNQILAGNRNPAGGFITFPENSANMSSMNTTISIVGTNMKLPSREHYERVAHIASHGQVRSINPVHMSVDGDTVFVFSTQTHKAKNKQGNQGRIHWGDYNTDLIGQLAAQAVEESIHDACLSAQTISFKGAIDTIIPGLKI